MIWIMLALLNGDPRPVVVPTQSLRACQAVAQRIGESREATCINAETGVEVRVRR